MILTSLGSNLGAGKRHRISNGDDFARIENRDLRMVTAGSGWTGSVGFAWEGVQPCRVSRQRNRKKSQLWVFPVCPKNLGCVAENFRWAGRPVLIQPQFSWGNLPDAPLQRPTSDSSSRAKSGPRQLPGSLGREEKCLCRLISTGGQERQKDAGLIWDTELAEPGFLQNERANSSHKKWGQQAPCSCSFDIQKA